MGVWYCTREDVAGAMDIAVTARDNRKIDRLIEAVSRGIEERCHRKFAPTIATKFFDWPNDQMGKSYRLWLDANELISASAVVAGGRTIIAGDYFLEPQPYGPPFDHLELNIGSNGAFSIGNTFQRDIAITGLFGYGDDAIAVGTSSNDVDLDDNIVTVGNGALVGVGSVLRVDDERIITTDRNMADTTLTVGADLDASKASTLIPISGATIYSDELIMVGAERMIVVDVAGSSLVVERQVDGSVLAAHSNGDKIYASRAFNVLRGQLGTAAATHTTGTGWTEWQPPGLIRELAVAETLWAFGQDQSGYARTIGGGDNLRSASLSGISDLRQQAYDQFGRKARTRAV